MKTVEVILRIEVDSDNESEVKHIVESILTSENLSYSRMIDLDGTNLEEKEYIERVAIDNIDFLD